MSPTRARLSFPEIPDVPFDPYRTSLYSPAELYDGLEGSYRDTPDARIYAWSRAQSRPPGLHDTLATSLHDDAITVSLDDLLARTDPEMTVGIMGGHGLRRDEEGYRRAAELGARLTHGGRLVATGGGPGAMEAANLGSACPPECLERSLRELAAVPVFETGIADWAGLALRVRSSWSRRAALTIGIPTWFYGHEPPNVFAGSIAKYFSNAQREDVLLDRCRGGLVYLPGAAGTVQEVFQKVTADFYATGADAITPLVLLGHHYWTEEVPAWPLLKNLAHGRPMASRIHLVDSVEGAVAALTGQ